MIILSFFFILNLLQSQAARILVVIPTPSISHQVIFRPLTQELARRGHDVTIVTTDPAFPKGEAPANLTEIDIHDLSYEIWQKLFIPSTEKQNTEANKYKIMLKVFYSLPKEQIKFDEVQKLIAENHFDLLLLEACMRPVLVFSHVFKAPVIQISSMGSPVLGYRDIGAYTHPMFYPVHVHKRSHNHTFWEKVTETYFDYNIDTMAFEIHEEFDEWSKNNIDWNIPPINELRKNVHSLFLNIHPIWEGNYPVPANVVYMWGLHQSPVNELPKDLKNFLDSSTNGVIYMSFGTNVKTSLLSSEKIHMFVRVFSQLPYDILWKWDTDVLPGCTKNIRIGKWFPQADLLRHPKIKLFITQGGMQSTQEAIDARVPLIGIPMLGDQWYNTEKFVHHKIGLQLNYETLEEEEFRKAINTVIGDKSYRENIARLGSLMRDQPMQPLERAVWWTEHVLRHGDVTYLRTPAANISWAEFYQIDLVIILLFILFFVTTLVLLLFCYIRRKIRVRFSLKKMS